MKRSDLKVGEAYLYNRRQAWANDEYGANKAVVVGLWWMAGTRMSHWTNRDVAEGTKGAGVLCDVTETIGGDNQHTLRMVVPVAYLRGPYERTRREVAERAAVQRDRLRAESDRDAAVYKRAQSLMERLAVLGVELQRWHYSKNDSRLLLPLDAVERLLDMADHVQTEQRED